MNTKKKIRIAHIIGKWVGGGVEVVVMNYYKYIDRSKIQFDFICDNDSTNIPYEEIEKLGGKVILIPPYQKIFKYQRELIKILKENNYKIVHSHINTLSVFSLRAAKKAKVPIRIAYSHSTTNKKEWKKNLLKQSLRPFSKIYATNYMCCSELAGRWLFGNKEFNKGNVYILNNAINVDEFKYNEIIRKNKRKEFGITDDTLVIGHVGRFVEQKNHDFLIEIFSELNRQEPNSILILVGQGPLMNNIKQKIDYFGLNGKVLFLGQRNDVNELYQMFDVFLFPSLYEGLGIVLIEAQCSGCPCVVSTEVPKVAKLTNIISFVSLDDNLNKWIYVILNNFKKYSRKSMLDDITNNNYNIKTESTKLEEMYYLLSNERKS